MSYATTPLAAQFRAALKAQGIKARVRAGSYCGCNVVQVATPTYEARFTPDQIEFFCAFAINAGMTLVQRMPINIETQRQLTERNEWSFHA